MGRKEQRSRPSVIHDRANAARFGGGGNGWNVLHLETLRARRLDQNSRRVRAKQAANVSANQRVVIFCLHPHALQNGVAEGACRLVGAIGDKKVIARCQGAHQRQ